MKVKVKKMNETRIEIAKCFVVFAICASGLYNVFKRAEINKLFCFKSEPQMLIKKMAATSFPNRWTPNEVILLKSRIPNMNSYMKVYISFLTFLFYLMMSKYIVISALDLHSLTAYRWLDCILLGRNTVTARIASHSKYYTLSFIVTILMWRAFIVGAGNDIKLDVIEFLLCDPKLVYKSEIRSMKSDGIYHSFKCPVHESQLASSGTQKREVEYESLQFMRNQLSRNCFQFILKPNRTVRCLFRYYKLTIIYFGCGIILLILVAIAVTYLSLPMFITKRGFELNYFHCVDWIEKQPNGRQTFEFIFQPRQNPSNNLTLLYFLPYVDYVSFNWFHLTRIGFDAADFILVWVSVAIYIITCNFIVVLIVLDCFIYSEFIKQKLREKIANIINTNKLLIGELEPVQESGSEILRLQSMLVDYFSTINRYNPFASFYSFFFFIVLSLNYVDFFFLNYMQVEMVNSIEMVVLLATATIIIILIASTFALVRKISYNLYQSIATLMALDGQRSSSKLRWMTILNFYCPKSRCCFRIHNTEISWLLSFKVSREWSFASGQIHES